MIWDVNHPEEDYPPEIEGQTSIEDDGLVVGTGKQSLRCPLTQTIYVDPVGNPSCPHIFSRQSIISLARQNRSNYVRCPIPGCNRNINVDALRTNEVLARRVENLQAEKIF